MNAAVGPLLSAVGVLLAAFGFVYNTQKDRIDAALADDDVPEGKENLQRACRAALAARNCAIWLLGAALLMWLLLLDEIGHKLAAAVKRHFALSTYSTPDVVFFVAANTWLVIALFLGQRARKLHKRVGELQEAPGQA